MSTTTALPVPTPWRDKLNGVLFVALMTVAVMQLSDLPFIRQLGISPLIVGIVCGMLYGNFLRGTMPADWAVGVNFTARRLLRIAVAFYGLNISIQQIADVGLPGLAVSVAVVVGTLLIGTTVGQRLLGLDRDTAMLTAAGSAICGAAAVLAFEPTLRAAPHKSAVAVATVVLFGTLSMFLYPIAYQAGWLHLSTQELGLYIGGTVHEVAQVVAAASNIDPATTEVATIVKMTRVALLVPVLLILGMWLRSAAARSGGEQTKTRLPIPWFAVGFLVLAIINSLHILPPDVVHAIRRLDVFALTMAMTALGIETRFGQIRKAGPKVLLLGLILYAWLVFGGYWIVKLAA
ncbi:MULTISPECIES: YeiH family protein [unclassified Bordetella]|uniref:YeiH family protein n=1 Tax=unclassified Bordetella TaxID=2630031 RepID=UPI001329A55A|nr:MULTISPECIES: YeiH family protein [unclassified Bordetella]MVW71762.1 putative sulfate exporter family transporter [Bordetella sp. 15P40C-2]MVW80814.1 putative sulfate exporter family transporter [Bordetella sp. 02P26C-1]